MAEYQLTQIIVGVVLLALMVTGIGIFIGDAVDKYSVTGYNNTSLENIKSTYDDIDNITNETKARIEELESNPGILNTLDAFFTQGYSAIRITKRSVESFDTIITTSTELDNTPGLGTMSSFLRSYFMTIVIIIIFIGLLLAFIIKSDRV